MADPGGDLRVPWNRPFSPSSRLLMNRVCTDTVARLQLASSK